MKSSISFPAGCVAIALGSNLGNSRAIVDVAIERLARTAGIRVDAHSRQYQTVAVGPPQPDYINACALLTTTLPPLELLQTLLTIEAQFGRIRRERWGARSLDLDLLLYGDLILDLPQLQIPHPRMIDRAFVLVPLAEIAPDSIEPVSGQTIRDLAQAVDCSGVHLAHSQPLTPNP